jgi:hypothetical protein
MSALASAARRPFQMLKSERSSEHDEFLAALARVEVELAELKQQVARASS